MTRPVRIEVDCSTGQSVEIELTDEEIAAMEAESAAFETELANREAELQAKEALKTSARAKLVAGEPLTEEEAALLVL